MVKDTDLLALAVEIGYRLQSSGAETYRVEEAVRRIFQAYGVKSGEVFSIPNSLIVSVIDSNDQPITRLRRIPNHGTDIDRIERVYDYCRMICRETPDVEQARAALYAMDGKYPTFPMWLQMAGYFVGGGAFTLFWGGSFLDALAGGLCSLLIGLSLYMMGKLEANLFVKTIIAAFLSALAAEALVQFGLGNSADYITIGALMTLVPGLVFTNFLRDLMAGDLVAGLIKLVEALLTAGAIAIGTFIAMAAAAGLWGV